MLKKKSIKNPFGMESSKSITNKNQMRNNSTNHFYVQDLYSKVLPRINSQTNKNDSRLTDTNTKSSFASTFYSTNSNNKKLFTENNQNNLINNKIFKYIMTKEKSHFKKKKKLELNPSYFESKPSKSKEIDLYIQEDYDNMGINKDYDYSNLIKKLDRWDEDNCLVQNNDKITLYNILNKFYKKKNMSEELKNLNTMESLLSSKTNYDKILKERLEYKNSKITTANIVPKKNNLNNSNNFNKHNSRNKKNNLNKYQFETDDLKLLSEKVKYETQLHNDLIFVNTLLYNKKLLKAEKSKELEDLYKTRSELRQAYNKNYNHNMKDYWDRYDEYEQRYKKLESLIAQQNKKEAEKNNNKKEENEKEKEENKGKEIKEIKEEDDKENNEQEKEEENEEKKEENENMENLDKNRVRDRV